MTEKTQKEWGGVNSYVFLRLTIASKLNFDNIDV